MQSDTPTYTSLLLAGVALAALTSCAAQPSARTSPSTNTRVDIADVPAELRDDYESFATNCSKCHDLERALAAPVTDARHWDMYVAKMMRTAGSAIHASERDPILRFLYWYTDRKNDRSRAAPSGTPAPVSEPSSTAPAQTNSKRSEPAAAGVAQSSTSHEATVTSEPQGESTP